MAVRVEILSYPFLNPGYEERFCRRSTLSLTLSTPAPNSQVDSNYPIPSEGCIYSDCVVVFRGPHEQYTKWEPENWSHLPVVSIPAARWPKLNQMGTKFAFDVEKELVRAKIRAALAACVYNGHSRVVIGNFGLGNSARNPARELAELWRDVFLYDPDFRGRFAQVRREVSSVRWDGIVRHATEAGFWGG